MGIIGGEYELLEITCINSSIRRYCLFIYSKIVPEPRIINIGRPYTVNLKFNN